MGERSSLLLHRDPSIPDRLRRLRLVKRLRSCYAWVTEDLSQRLRGLSTVNEDVTKAASVSRGFSLWI